METVKKPEKCPSGFAWCARGALLCGACQPFSEGTNIMTWQAIPYMIVTKDNKFVKTVIFEGVMATPRVERTNLQFEALKIYSYTVAKGIADLMGYHVVSGEDK